MNHRIRYATTQDSEKFFDECCFNIDQLYPNWTQNEYGKHPICIPECLDVNKSWIKVADNEVSKKDKDSGQLKGQKREKCTHFALQTCTVGGLVVFDFHISDFCSQLKMDKDEQFQIDALLFHPYLGICELETKSSAEQVEDAEIGFNAAGEMKEQLKRHAMKLRNLYKKVTGCQDFDIPSIRSLYCIPMDKCKSTWSRRVNGKYGMLNQQIILDRSVFSQDKEKFMEFWNSQIYQVFEETATFPNYFEDERFTRFVKIIAGFRSHVYISMGSNVSAIHQYIAQQAFQSTQNHATSVDSQLIFLTAKQKAIVENESLGQIIYGVPGSGKTIILMLKALQAAKQPMTSRKERVFVFTWSHVMLMKYQKFFKFWKDQCKRKVFVFRNIRLAEFREDSDNSIDRADRSLNHVCSADEKKILIHDFDDFFADECDWDDAESKIFTHRIENINHNIIAGKSVMVVTNPVEFGLYNGKYVRRKKYDWLTDIKQAKWKSLKHADYAFHQLNESVRCTGAILEHWKQFFVDQIPIEIRQGHNIRGTAVIVKKGFQDITELCTEVHRQIQQNLLASQGQENGQLQMKDIAVLLVQHKDLYSETVETELNRISQANNSLVGPSVAYGDIYSQIKHNSCVAVVHSWVTHSCEWTCVFVLESTDQERRTSEEKQFQMIAYSRATSKLIILQADFLDTYPGAVSSVVLNERSEESMNIRIRQYPNIRPVVTIFKRNLFKDFQQLCTEVHKLIEMNLITFRFRHNIYARLQMKDIAVLLTPPFNIWSKYFRRKLNKESLQSDRFSNGHIVSYGDINWQLEDQDCVTVGAPHIAPCREWALVILLEAQIPLGVSVNDTRKGKETCIQYVCNIVNAMLKIQTKKNLQPILRIRLHKNSNK